MYWLKYIPWKNQNTYLYFQDIYFNEYIAQTYLIHIKRNHSRRSILHNLHCTQHYLRCPFVWGLQRSAENRLSMKSMHWLAFIYTFRKLDPDVRRIYIDRTKSIHTIRRYYTDLRCSWTIQTTINLSSCRYACRDRPFPVRTLKAPGYKHAVAHEGEVNNRVMLCLH
jgi:hypothetical protein